MNNKKGKEFLANVALNTLEKAYEKELHGKAKIRLQCAMLRKKGENLPFISQVTGLPMTTISGILTRFENKGIIAKDAIKQEGQPKKLTEKDRKKLRRILEKSPQKQGIPFVVWTTKLVQYMINKKFGVSYVLMQVHRVLKKLGLSMQKPRPEHIKANKELQRRFKKNFDGELRNLLETDMRSAFWTKAHTNLNHI